tara:strand:+ start:5165 stop:6442 length:1278 start_codon:yes stop_codon:yes gene_type:complete
MSSPHLDPSIQRATVFGLGRFGGGLGATEWLLDQGIRVLVTDQAASDALATPIALLERHPRADLLDLRLGSHRTEDFTSTDLVVANPAVPRPWDHPCLQAAWNSGTPVTTEIGLVVSQLDRSRIVGITGTAGKSTTATMTHHVLDACGVRCVLGGNIGGSLLGSMATVRDADAVVLELSSAMLWWLGATDDAPIGAPGWSPAVAVTTNIEPNHVDWHGSEDHYRRCKQGLSRHQHEGEPHLQGDPGGADVPLCIPGGHNQANARLAIAAASCIARIDATVAADSLRRFTGLPHRLERITSSDGLHYFNDSKSTTPGATLLAIDAMDDPDRIHLIAGGYDKGVDLDAIAHRSRTLAGLYAVGATGDALAEMSGHEACGTLEEAVERAKMRMEAGDVLLLSPGCASWDQYENFEARGDHFRSLVSRA